MTDFWENVMPILTQPSFGPKLAIGFITGGALIDVWTLVWRFTIAGEELSPTQRFWFMGLLFTGLTFIVIGAFLGHIGQAARKAEMPPPDALQAEEIVQARAAANPNPAVAAAGVIPPNASPPNPAPPPAGAPPAVGRPGQPIPGAL